MSILKILLLSLLLIVAVLILWWPNAGGEANGFPGSFSFSSLASKLTGGKPLESYVGAPANSKPLPKVAMPTHPFLDNRGYAGAHADSYNSGVQPYSGPLGINPVVYSRMVSWEFGACSTQAFDR